MVKCLISKLYGSVDNDNLPKLNEFKFIVSKESKETLYSYISMRMIAFVKSIGGDFEATLDNGAYFQRNFETNGKKYTTLRFADIQDETISDYAVKFPNTGVTTITIKGKYYFPNYDGVFITPYKSPSDFEYIHLYRIRNASKEIFTIDKLAHPEDVVDTTWIIFPDEILMKTVKLEKYLGTVIDNPSSLPNSLKAISGTITSWAPNSKVSGNMLDIGAGVFIDNNDSVNNMLVDMSNLTGNKDSNKNIVIWTSSAYTPSEAAKAAIKKLKSECNYSSINIGGVEQTGD
jgi:hypothetical protein